jgi:hypothetical protein
VLRRSSRDRFVHGSGIPFAWLRRVEDACISALPENFRMLTLSPLEPLGTHSVVAGVDQNNVVSTIRSTEVGADPTNGLALRAAWGRAGLLANQPGSPERVRLAALQRVVRGQRFEEDGRSFAHFELLGMVTAGRDTGNLAFEHEAAVEHLRFIATVVQHLGASRVRIELTDFSAPRYADTIDRIGRELSAEDVDVVERPDRSGGRRYYDGFCFKAFPTFQSEPIEVADGGFVDWTRKLVGSEKERLLISGIGLDRVAMSSPVAQA